MSKITLSYTEALHGIISADDMEGMLGLVENHKNWGAFSAKMPSYVVVSLVDAIKRLKEEASGPEEEPFFDEDPDAPPTVLDTMIDQHAQLRDANLVNDELDPSAPL